MQIGNILDNTTELYMIKYTFGEIFSSDGATLPKNPSDQAVLAHGEINLIFPLHSMFLVLFESSRYRESKNITLRVLTPPT